MKLIMENWRGFAKEAEPKTIEDFGVPRADLQKELTAASRKQIKDEALSPREKELLNWSYWACPTNRCGGLETGTHKGAEWGLPSAYDVAKKRAKKRGTTPETELDAAREWIEAEMVRLSIDHLSVL